MHLRAIGRATGVLLLWAALLAGAWADHARHVTFRTDPEVVDAFVLSGPGNQTRTRLPREDSGAFLLDLDKDGVANADQVTVLLVASEHQLMTNVPAAALTGDNVEYPAPPEPPLHLDPTTASAQVADFFTPVHIEEIVGAVVVIGLIAFAVPAVIGHKSKQAATQQAAARSASENEGGTAFEGRVIGGYRVLHKLGRGGLGVGAVYEAEPESSKGKADGHVAIKIILNSEDNESLQRAKRGLQAMASLNHPNILKLLSEGTANKYFYLVMELAAGGTLEDKIKPEGMSVGEALTIVRPIMKAVTFAHNKGFVHRNLAPENILYTSSGTLKVAGFGLVKKTTASSQITVRPTILGMPSYMAPEQVRAEELTPAADQYALGIMLYELLVGKPPFQGNNMEIMMAHQQTPPPSVRQARPDLPAELDAVVGQMLAKAPGARFPSLEAVGEVLDRVPV
ncbi:MAG TPA: protein kinase [Candidatus Xenobia bacterium]